MALSSSEDLASAAGVVVVLGLVDLIALAGLTAVDLGGEVSDSESEDEDEISSDDSDEDETSVRAFLLRFFFGFPAAMVAELRGAMFDVVKCWSFG